MKDVIDEMRKRIEGIESQVGILTKHWIAKSTAAPKPVAKKK